VALLLPVLEDVVVHHGDGGAGQFFNGCALGAFGALVKGRGVKVVAISHLRGLIVSTESIIWDCILNV
jgi:hypothetical protein